MKANASISGERLFRFLLAGAVNTGFGIAVYPVLLWLVPWLRDHYMVGLALAQVISVGFAYFSYKVGVFRTRGNVAREFSVFSTFYVVVLAINWISLPLLVEFIGIRPMIAQLMFIVPVIIGSYLWHTRVTFRQIGH